MKNIKACLTSKSIDYKTPENLYKLFINNKKAIDLFPYKCEYDQYTIKYDNKILFCNPPFKDMNKVVKYLIDLYLNHNCEIWLLCPVRTDTKWFNKITELKNEIYFFSHRLKYNNLKTTAPFPSCLIHIDKKIINTNKYTKCSVDYFIEIESRV